MLPVVRTCLPPDQCSRHSGAVASLHLVTHPARGRVTIHHQGKSGRRGAVMVATKSSRIVVVEDEPAIRRGVSDALRISGYDVAEAADGVKGLAEASRHDVDLILLDLMLPRKDGLEVLRELRQVRPA